MSDKNNITKFYYHSELTPPTPSRQQYLREQVTRLKGVKQPEQRTEAWYAMREERITASDFATALNESPYQRDYTLLQKKVTRDRKFSTNSAILWGVKYEDAAILVYEHRNKTKVSEYGCIEHPNNAWLGASPDGITDDGIMVEIKCPSSREVTGKIPSYYWCQVQGQLEICELDRCDFLECKLEEYSREDYLADNYEGDYFYSSIGMEKGSVIEFFKIESRSKFFVFLPLGLGKLELDELVLKEKEKHTADPNVIYGGIAYWRITQVSCIPVYRNQEWFNQTALPKFKEFWKSVLYFRTRPLWELNAHVVKVKEENKIKRMELRNLKKLENQPKVKAKPKPRKPRKSKAKMVEMKMGDYLDSENSNFIIIDGERYDIDENEIFGNKDGGKINNGVIGNLEFSNSKFTGTVQKETFSNKNKTYIKTYSSNKNIPDIDYDDMDLMNSGKINFDDMDTFQAGKSYAPDVDYDDMNLMNSGKINFDNMDTFQRKTDTFQRKTSVNVPVIDINYNNMKLMNSGKVNFDKIETFNPKIRTKPKTIVVNKSENNIFVNKRVKLRKKKESVDVFNVEIDMTSIEISSSISYTLDDKKNENFEIELL